MSKKTNTLKSNKTAIEAAQELIAKNEAEKLHALMEYVKANDVVVNERCAADGYRIDYVIRGVGGNYQVMKNFVKV